MKRVIKAGRPPYCRYSARMSGVFGQRFTPKNSATSVCVSSLRYSVNSRLLLRQAVHYLGTGECLGQEDRLRASAFDLGYQPLPEGEGLCMRVVNPEDPHTLLDPELDDALQLIPQFLPVLCLEVEGVDVLILLGRVLGVLGRAIRPATKPLRMLADVRVIGSTLKGDVERQLQAVLCCAGHQAPEVLESTELWMHRFVSAFRRADRPGAAGVIRSGRRAVVAPLAEAAADGVDRRQIEDVEAHGGDVIQAFLDVPERAVQARLRRAGAREQLVPRAEAGARAVHHHAQFFVVLRGIGPGGVTIHQRGQLWRERLLGAFVPTYAQGFGERLQPPGVVVGRQRRGRLDHRRADQQLDRYVLPGFDTFRQIALPGFEVVYPGAHRVTVTSQFRDRELTAPATVDQWFHGNLGPSSGRFVAVEQQTRERVVAIGEHIRFDDHPVAGDALDRESAGVDLRRHALDHDPSATFLRLHCLTP